ncbi:MAG: hypothetical protein GFH27_549297n71 [Chloroflexi bacterium AL-W]|nr:hypothetical protein [Chloroflexi bacterium AL-N10]NOK76081.1 hypothetical protein [Chloroflexi bacterium AL-N5]NOK82554.1 hypothetical protein [Chloroflexi bacterium AL-W]NOK93352.1 hypothetical protein [Chloroflexi bacterium AL-N15]
MTEAILLLACISVIGLIGLLGAIYNWEWIYRSADARLLTALIGRSAMRVCTGIADVVFIVGPWVFLATR